jgi:nitrite reductase/ring-hydroxylating ferredoxin subunit
MEDRLNRLRPATTPRSRLEAEPLPRRDFLGLAAAGSAVMTLAFACLGIGRLPRAAVLPSPSKKFRVTLPDSLVPGGMFIPPGRPIAIVRDAEGVFALSIVCTHLGCLVKQGESGFDCPCHGSQFAPDGTVRRGPAPKSLPWLQIAAAGGNTFVVDAGRVVPPGTKALIA